MSPAFAIIEYSDKYQPEFKALNLEWLEKYNLLEDRDLEALDNPRQAILEQGGVIYLALENFEVIASAAVIREHGQYELAKMAVASDHRGKGISKILLERCIAFVKNAGSPKIILYSNSQLTTAIGLYRSYGFKDIELTNSPFVTADVKMELTL